MKTLLIGNGLNLTNEKNAFLKTEEIFNRFKKNLSSYWELLNELFGLEILDYDDAISKLSKQDGIEELAGKIFEYVYTKIRSARLFSQNDKYRLVELLSEISIKSIFWSEDKWLIPEIDEKYIKNIKKKYDNILTLNYIENWDNEEKVKYLHGNFKKYMNSSVDIGSYVLSNNKVYEKYKKNEYEKVDFKEIIFMPINDIINKFEYVGKGLMLSDTLFPADDLFPYDGKDIYKDLENLNEIEVFGMSPYGDDSIIEKIKNIKNKKIYVYGLNQNEIERWKSFGIDDCFDDSNNFLEE